MYLGAYLGNVKENLSLHKLNFQWIWENLS